MVTFVTGSDGFVGTRLLPRLEAAGHDVRILATDVDICDAEAVDGAVAASVVFGSGRISSHTSSTPCGVSVSARFASGR